MQRMWMAALALVVVTMVGCDGLFSPRANVVASAAGQELTTDELQALAALNPSGQVPPAEGLAVMSGLWVDLMLFAEARLSGQLEADSTDFRRVMWPQILQARITAWQDTLQASRPAPSPAAADSAYEAGELRVFQHILVTPSGTTRADTSAARARIAGLLAQVRRGASFGQLAATTNGDGSREDQGYLPVGPRGQFVPEFETAAWALAAGEVSDVVPSPFGFHLIRRPTAEEARERFVAVLGQAARQRADSLYVAGLVRDHAVRLVDDVAKKTREGIKDMDRARAKAQKLASFKGGSFTTRDLARWAEALPSSAVQGVDQTPDSVLVTFIDGLVLTTLIQRQMDSAGLALPDSVELGLQLSYRATMDQMALALDLGGDPTQPLEARLDSAYAKVDRFVTQLASGNPGEFRGMPPSLSGMLRERARHRLNPAAIARVAEQAAAKQPAAPAAPSGPQAGQPGPMPPAPSGPPAP